MGKGIETLELRSENVPEAESVCPRKYSDCIGSDHHWIAQHLGTDEPLLQCKHCPATKPYPADAEPEPVGVNERREDQEAVCAKHFEDLLEVNPAKAARIVYKFFLKASRENNILHITADLAQSEIDRLKTHLRRIANYPYQRLGRMSEKEIAKQALRINNSKESADGTRQGGRNHNR